MNPLHAFVTGVIVFVKANPGGSVDDLARRFSEQNGMAVVNSERKKTELIAERKKRDSANMLALNKSVKKISPTRFEGSGEELDFLFYKR